MHYVLEKWMSLERSEKKLVLFGVGFIFIFFILTNYFIDVPFDSVSEASNVSDISYQVINTKNIDHTPKIDVSKSSSYPLSVNREYVAICQEEFRIQQKLNKKNNTVSWGNS